MDKICVLMSTYNGEKYLQEQIDSVFSQKNVEVLLYVRDDGSTDNTISILQKNATDKNIKYYSGNNLKPALSFFDLMKNAPDFDYYAFCDQDDVWLDDKLSIALTRIKNHEKDVPMLYYGRPRLVDSKLRSMKTPLATLDVIDTFESSIIESNATGCTMVFNRKLLEIVRSKTPDYIYMHDLWIHKICLLFNGVIFFDKDVHILYRQHNNNVVGMTNSVIQKNKAHMNSIKNKPCQRSKVIGSLYDCYKSSMNEEDKKLCELVINYKKSICSKIRLAFCFKIRTRYFMRNIRFIFAVLLEAF